MTRIPLGRRPVFAYYDDESLAAEVIYLHALYRRGQPHHHHPPPPHPHRPTTATHFKRKSRPPREFNKGSSGIEWPVPPVNPPDPPVNPSGWPELRIKPSPNTRLATPEEEASLKWNQLQHLALDAAKSFFAGKPEFDYASDEEDEEDGYDDVFGGGDDVMVDGGVEVGARLFFDKLFGENNELRGYYVEKSGGGGDFCCLVCAGTGEKFGTRFKDCVALVQHSVSIRNKRKSHRAYGEAICSVLGWDVNRLPSVVSSLKTGESQVNTSGGDSSSSALVSNTRLTNAENKEKFLDMDSNGNEVLCTGASDLPNTTSDEFMICEQSFPAGDEIKSSVATSMGVGNVAEGIADGFVNLSLQNPEGRAHSLDLLEGNSV